MPRGSCRGWSSSATGAVASGENWGVSSALPKALAAWAPARARSSPASERSEVLVMPTRPSPFHTRTVIELRWAPFICLASPRSTCTEVSVLQAAPRSHCWMPWAEASRSRVLRSWVALRPVFTVVLVMISGPPR